MEKNNNDYCAYVCAHLSEYHDEELPLDDTASIKEHLSSCPKCKIEHDLLLSVTAAISDSSITPPTSLYRAVMKSVKWHSFMRKTIKLGSVVAAATFIITALIYAKLFLLPQKNMMAEDNKSDANVNDISAGLLTDALQEDCTPAQNSDTVNGICDLPEELCDTMNVYYASNNSSIVAFMSMKADAFEDLRTSLPESSILYIDGHNIAFKYQDVPNPEQDKTQYKDNIIIIACLKDESD